MTSVKYSNKRVYFHSFKKAFSSSAGVAVICLLAMLLLIPVSTSIIHDSSIFNLTYTHHQMKYRFFYESLRPLVNGFAVITGIMISLVQFRFMLVKRYSDAYFSLGIKRGKLLLLHSLAGILQIFFITFLPMFISMIMNIKAFGELGYGSVIFSGFLYMVSGLFTLSLLGFVITSLVCCISGTLMEAIAFSVLLLGAPSIILYGVNALTKTLLFGNAFGVTASTGTVSAAETLLNKLDFLNPVYFFYNISADYNMQNEHLDGYVLPDMQWIRIGGWIICGIILFIIAIMLLKRRKAEIAGISGQNCVMNFIFTFLVSFLGFCIVLEYSASAGRGLAFAASILSFLILYMVLQFLQVRSIFKKNWKLLVQLGVVLIITLILTTGGLGYSGKIPELENIESAQMTYVGSPNYLSGQPGGISNGKQYYLTNSYTFTGQEDIETVIKLHKALIEAGKGKLALNTSEFSSTTVPYDITVTYTLKNGSKLTRYYDRTTYTVLEEMLALDDTDTVKTAISHTIIKGEGLYYASGAYKNGTVYVSNSWYTNPRQLILDEEQRQKLLSCIAEDVSNQSVEERYFPQTDAKGVIMFSLNNSDSLTFGYNFDNTVVYLTPEFENTWKFFEDAGLTYCFDFTDEIESIELQECNPYISVVNSSAEPSSPFFMGYLSDKGSDYILTKDFQKNMKIIDSEKIKELIPVLQNSYFMSRGGYLACVKIKDKDQYIYKYLSAQAVPDYIYK